MSLIQYLRDIAVGQVSGKLMGKGRGRGSIITPSKNQSWALRVYGVILARYRRIDIPESTHIINCPIEALHWHRKNLIVAIHGNITAHGNGIEGDNRQSKREL